MYRLAGCLAFLIAVLLAVAFSNGVAEAKFIEPSAVTPVDFVTVIDNPYFPLVPGTTFVYEAETEDEFILDEVTVTNQTKEILGVTTTVVHDVEHVNGLLTEETDDFYAQDRFGNVWYFGEDTTAFIYDDEGNLIETTKEGSWEAGVNGAQPGIIMLAEPRSGLSYRQEFAVGVAEDFAKILRLNARVSVEFGDFDNVLVTKEWTPLERGSIEFKYYAPGVGLVLIEEHHGKTVRVELVDVIVQ
ncbi:MAG: hypothetical protein ACYC27_16720 [Armatimonadota bacterium]